MLEIKKADLSNTVHATALIDLLDTYALDPMGGGKPLSAYVKNNLASVLHEKNNIHIFLAFSEDKAVGLVVCIESFSTFLCKPILNIHDLIVLPEYRGKGYSRKLMKAAETYAVKLGCCKLTLEVLEGNTIARNAYSSFGFTGYELDPKMGKALFMEKKLP